MISQEEHENEMYKKYIEGFKNGRTQATKEIIINLIVLLIAILIIVGSFNVILHTTSN